MTRLGKRCPIRSGMTERYGDARSEPGMTRIRAGMTLFDGNGTELAGEGAVAGADGFQEGVELGAVVHVAEVAELVEHDVVGQFRGEGDQAQVQVDVAQ